MKNNTFLSSGNISDGFYTGSEYYLSIANPECEDIMGLKITNEVIHLYVYFNKLGGKKYKVSIRRTYNNSVQLHFLKEARKFLDDNSIEGKFYSIYTTDEKNTLLFVLGESEEANGMNRTRQTSELNTKRSLIDRLKDECIEDELINMQVQDESGESDAYRNLSIGNSSSSERVVRNPEIARDAIKKAHYKCEYDNTHTTFKKETGNQYMEAHHLIPCTKHNAEDYYKKFGVNIDCKENIVSLCPTCHRRIHYGSQEEKREIIKVLYEMRKEALRKIGVEITLEELYKLYK